MTLKIDNSLPNRISVNVTTGRQTQGLTFGEKVSQGLQTAGSAIASGASLVGGVLPGVGLVSAAVSSVGQLTNMPGSTAAAGGYAATGVVAANGGANGPPIIATGNGLPTVTGGTGSPGQVGVMNNELAAMTSENSQLLQVQIALQRENQTFTSVSNALKTKHDTVKNTISNVR